MCGRCISACLLCNLLDLSKKITNKPWSWQRLRLMSMVKPVNPSVYDFWPSGSVRNNYPLFKYEAITDVCINSIPNVTFYGNYEIHQNPRNSTQSRYKLVDFYWVHFLIASLLALFYVPTNFSHPVFPSFDTQFKVADDTDSDLLFRMILKNNNFLKTERSYCRCRD